MNQSEVSALPTGRSNIILVSNIQNKNHFHTNTYITTRENIDTALSSEGMK